MELLEAASAALAIGGVAPALWHRWLDTTRRSEHLLALPDRTVRHRWADAAVEAVTVSAYGLTEMLAQREPPIDPGQPDAWTESRRTAANLEAMQLLVSKPAGSLTVEDRRVLAR